MDASFPRQSPPSEHLAHPGPEELEVTIKSHRTYMNLTDAFLKQTFARPRSSAPSITCGSGATGDPTVKLKPGPKPQPKPQVIDTSPARHVRPRTASSYV